MTQPKTINNSKLAPAPTLYSTVVKLIANQSGLLPTTQGRLAQAAFLDIIRSVDPTLSQALHTKNQRRPYTVSPLQGLGRIKGREVKVRRGREVWLRFTLLGSELFATFTRFLLMNNEELRMKNGAPGLRLGELEFAITEMLTTPGSDDWAGYIPVTELCQRWQTAPINNTTRKIAIEFASATVFSRSSNKDGMGKFMETFPSPPMFFGSLAAKWNDHMPLPLDKQAIRDYAEETAVVGLYNMESRLHHYWGNPQIGAVGRVTYQLKDKADVEMIRALNLLADFAFYSGVGAKTTMGMGMVRRISNN